MERKEITFTKGKFTIHKCFETPIYCEANDSFQNSWDIKCGEKPMFSSYYQSNKGLGIHCNNQDEAEGNAELICEAFNLANQTGMTPVMLKQELDKAIELLIMARATIKVLVGNNLGDEWEEVKAITSFISSYEGKTDYKPNEPQKNS